MTTKRRSTPRPARSASSGCAESSRRPCAARRPCRRGNAGSPPERGAGRQPRGQLHLVAAGNVGPVRRPAARLGQTPAEVGDEEPGEERDEEGDPPALAVEERADGATDGQAHAQADVAQALLNGEGLPAALGPVVVGDDAAARGVGDRLTEAERGADQHQQAEGRRGHQPAQGADDGPQHDGHRHGAGPVPAVGQVAGRHRDDPVDQDEGREQQPDGGVAHAEGRLDLVAAAPDDVLVHPVDEQGEPHHPHGPVADDHAPGGGGPAAAIGPRRVVELIRDPWRLCCAHDRPAACRSPEPAAPLVVESYVPGVYPAGRAIDFISRKPSRPSGPNSRPTPDSL